MIGVDADFFDVAESGWLIPFQSQQVVIGVERDHYAGSGTG